MKKHYLFDLDDTLVDTCQLGPYRKTGEGKVYLVEHMAKVPTQLYSTALLDIIRTLHRQERVTIVTNAPTRYAEEVLKKHQFPDVPLIGNAQKPDIAAIANVCNQHSIRPEHLLVVGDAPLDIVWAQETKIASVGVSWGHAASREQLEQAEPQRLIDKPESLEGIISGFDQGKLLYTPPERFSRYEFLPRKEWTLPVHKVELHHLDTYHSWGSGVRDYFSREILRYKSAKEFTLKEINGGATDDFFNNGEIRHGNTYRSAVTSFIGRVHAKLAEISPGKALLLAAPNSLPAFCYKTEINRILAVNVAKKQDLWEVPRKGVFHRVHPKLEAHLGGDRSLEEHYRTVGMEKVPYDGYDTIVLLDDVHTSGSQLSALARMAEYGGFQGKILGLTLGKNG